MRQIFRLALLKRLVFCRLGFLNIKYQNLFEQRESNTETQLYIKRLNYGPIEGLECHWS